MACRFLLGILTSVSTLGILPSVSTAGSVFCHLSAPLAGGGPLITAVTVRVRVCVCRPECVPAPGNQGRYPLI